MKISEILVRTIAMDSPTFSLDVSKYQREIKAAIRAINCVKHLSPEDLAEVESDLNKLVIIKKQFMLNYKTPKAVIKYLKENEH